MTQDLKRPARIKDPALMRLLKFEYDCCEISGLTGDLHLHHVILKGQGGDDLRENIICMSKKLHELYHQGQPAARLLIAQHVDTQRPDVACYIAEKLGSADALLEWFARHTEAITQCVCDRINTRHCPVHGNLA